LALTASVVVLFFTQRRDWDSLTPRYSIKPALYYKCESKLEKKQMKKLLLLSTAAAGVAMLSTPASAALKMDLGGYFEGYGVYADNNDPAAAASRRDFEFRRQNQIFVNGESTLDNGLTIGAHTQLNIADTSSTATTAITGTGVVIPGGSTGAVTAAQLAGTTSVTNTQLVDETYLYASGQWGRINFGQEDGAAYLLQVAAPSADSNVDGMRVYIQGLNTVNWDANLAGLVLSYHHADFRQTDRLTYLTPKFNGFQAGVSYAPKTGTSLVGANSSGTAAMALDAVANAFESPWEVAARWDGRFSGFDLSAGGGYSNASAQITNAAPAVGSDDLETYNFGANVGMSGFSLGGAYKHTNSGINAAAGNDADIETWVVGGAYDNGPYHVGVSYFDQEIGNQLLAAPAAGESSVHRYAVGGGYTFGPGMTFRGSVDWGKFDTTAAAADRRFTQVTVGTDVQF
jgi:outer membrane protein OmpU